MITNTISILKLNQKLFNSSCLVANTKLVKAFLTLLFKNGFISGFCVVNSYKLRVYLKYDKTGCGLLGNVTAISKPGKKNYGKLGQFCFHSMSNCSVVSSSKGALFLNSTKKKKFQPGEFFCKV